MMKTILTRIMPDNDSRRKFVSVIITALAAGALTCWGIYGIGEYGMALFTLTPFFIGATPVMLYGLKKKVSTKDAFLLALATLALFTIGIIVFAIEGLICIVMASPLVLLLVWIGSVIGQAIIDNKPGSAVPIIFIITTAIPAVAFFEKDAEPTVSPVTTSVEINASPQTVWKHVVEFPELKTPEEFIFKTGIAYPINATIKGSGVGAVRHCNFTTGSFVEPITVWDEPNLLRFDVVQQPAPMKEISFWDIDAPHLHDYFVSKQGQFKLTALPNGRTLLEGTTWYYHNIKPEFYWRRWSNYIIHTIHNRVLKHIKENSERDVSSVKKEIS